MRGSDVGPRQPSLTGVAQTYDWSPPTVWVTCPSCMGVWCRTHDMHIDQCACPVSPVKRRVSWLDPVGTDKTPKELAREFIHWRCDRMDRLEDPDNGESETTTTTEDVW